MSEYSLRSAGLQGGPTDDRPLSDQEYQLLQRLLSDPFSLPIQFKTWLVSYLESSDLNLPMSAVNGLSATLGLAGIGAGTLGIFPAGIILPYGGTAAPTGSLMCDGALYSRTAQKRLYDAILLNYSPPGTPADSFYVPDIQGRYPVGAGGHSSIAALNSNEGLPKALRKQKHRHPVNDPGHAHMPEIENAGANPYSGAGGSPTVGGRNVEPTGAPAGASKGFTGITVGDPADPLDSGAFVTVNFIIVN